ncbi:MAG: dihydrofolate reductase [Prevotellaceae bacterium]|jgi:dihydrofolate reductase|nr:dihydrofolate reductase [Prevotellaceae bacterium]
MLISIIVAIAANNGIGKNNRLLWHIPEDLKHFKQITSGHAVIMGRKTFDSIGRYLPNRQNIVITRNAGLRIEGVQCVPSLQAALEVAQGSEVFIIGGESIYREALPLAHKLYVTHVQAAPAADTFFPAIAESDWQIVDNEDFEKAPEREFAFSFTTYCRKA